MSGLRPTTLAIALFVCVLGATAPAMAQSVAFARAEQAYLDVDFEATLSAAQEALREGGHTAAELTRIYMLLGVCSAANDENDRARDYFVRMLALDPNAQLDDTVPPRLRGPFLEARGTVSARPGRLTIEVGLARTQSALHLSVIDPFRLTHTIRVHARLEGVLEFTTTEVAVRPVQDVRHDGAATADRVEYWIELLDPFGNQVMSTGSEYEPRVVGRLATTTPSTTPGAGGGDLLAEPWFWVVAGVVVVGGAVAGTWLGLEATRIEVRPQLTLP